MLGAIDAGGRDTADVTVTLDDAPFLAHLTGQAQAIDPGAHLLRFEHAGSPDVEQNVIVREGERRRAITVRFLAPRIPREEPGASPGSARPIALAALGGIVIASGVTFAVLGLGAQSEADHLRTTCAPTCDPSDVNAARAKQIGANVALGVGLLAAGAGAILVLTWPARSQSGASPIVAVRPIHGGAIAGFAVPF